MVDSVPPILGSVFLTLGSVAGVIEPFTRLIGADAPRLAAVLSRPLPGDRTASAADAGESPPQVLGSAPLPMTWQLALAVAAALFCAFIVWRVRPSFGPRKVGKARRQALSDARTRLATAKSPGDRAVALCDAGDALATSVGGLTSALGYYLRAMRSDPTAPEPIVRAARGLSRRPRTVESLLWRRLGGASWEGAGRSAAVAALTELERVYAGPLRNRLRARAVGNALVALGAPRPTGRSSKPPPVAAAGTAITKADASNGAK